MVTFSKMYIFCEPNSFHSKKQMWFIFQTFKVNILPFQQYHYFKDTWGKVVHFLFWCEPQIVTFWNYTFSWTTFFLLQEINVVHISDIVRPIFCLSNDTTFIKILKEKVVQFFVKCEPHIVTFLKKIFNLFHEPHSFAYKKPMWFTYHTWTAKSFGFPTKLYSCYDGPSESGIFSPLDEPLLTSYLRK